MPVDKPGCGVSSLRLIPQSFRDQDEASRESITRPRLSRPLLRSPETQPPALSSPKSYPSGTKQETPSRQTRDCTSRTRCRVAPGARGRPPTPSPLLPRSEEHTSELQSRFGISYAVFCLKKKNTSH